ncbi:MAG: heliorhodopsin HeR [Spirochaetia bacterium]|nr:heliorhodopsin HeR [Spirochaetia bacterium]
MNTVSANVQKEEVKYTKLKRFNLIMGFLHLIQGVFMWVVSNDTSYPIFTNFLKFNVETFSLSPEPELFMNLRFGPAVAIFLLLSAAAHFYLATFGNARYRGNLEKGMNPVRFYEYALSSSLMIVLIGMLSGIWDLGAILLMFFINATMNLFGIMMEYHNQGLKKTNWTSFIYGSIAGIIPWVVIFIYFIGSITSGEAKPPAFVYAIIPTLFVFFNIFAINMILQYKKIGKWKDYLFGERAYIILSLAAKTVLAWIIFAGTLAPV